MSVERQIERSYPYAVAVASIVGWFYLFRWLNLNTQEAKDLFATILNVSAIAAGFLGTAASILLTMGTTPVIKDLKDSGTLSLLYRYVVSAVHHQFALVLLSVILLVLYPKLHYPRLLFWLAVFWGTAATLASMSSYRVIRLFGRVVTADASSGDENQPTKY